jgi:hypothetical protein
MRRTAQLLRSLLSILLITAGEGIQFLWLAVSSRAELSAEVLFLRKQLAFYREHQVPPRKLTDAARFSLVLWSQLFHWKAALMIVKPETLIGWHRKGFNLFWRSFRRIKSVSLTLPCVVGPYTTLSCTLRLLKNSIRINTTNGDNGYPHNVDDDGFPADDSRFVENNVPVKSIAGSTAQNDSGMFEMAFQDSRYLPFEGVGVVSSWLFELFNDSGEDFGGRCDSSITPPLPT